MPPKVKREGFCNGVEEAIAAADGQKPLSDALQVSQQRISTYKLRGYMPEGKAILCEHLYGIPLARLIKPKVSKRGSV